MKICPHCGAQIEETAKFCSECGYNVNGSAYSAQVQSNSFWIKLLPNVLFLVFAVALFGVLAEPVMAGLIGANVYSLCDSTIVNLSSFTALSVVLVIFAGLTVVTAICTTVVKCLECKGGKLINSKLDWISFGCYVLFFVLGIVLLAVVASEKHVLVGACSIWLIVLPIIFAGLFGAYCAYNKFGDSVVAGNNNEQSIEDSAPIQQEQKIEEGETPTKKQTDSIEVAQRKKKIKALLPSILLLVASAIMWVLYATPAIRYAGYEDYYIYHISVFDLNFANIGSATKLFGNIFQYTHIVYLAIVTVVAILLLAIGVSRIKKDDNMHAKICNRALIVTLILYIIFVLISSAMLLFTVMTLGTWFEFGCVAIIAVAAIGLIGTIIAMVKLKKKLKQQATNTLE